MTSILIVDDDPDMAELMGHMSDILGFEHRFVPTGAEALAACAERQPDAIVLDVMLEETDGWTLFEKLRPATSGPDHLYHRLAHRREPGPRPRPARRRLPGQAHFAPGLRCRAAACAGQAGAPAVRIKLVGSEFAATLSP